ncbi:MAG: MBL fold metallo-hydrolase, partial [Mycobacterium sp.]|nr:MBL fold metallo-hydrolase [Mycobacterium sp.]
SDPMHSPAFEDSVRPVLDAGLVETVAADRTVAPGVRLRMTPGHTPGHMCVWIGDDCVITGDVVHHPVQCGHPEWTATGDGDPDLARSARRDFLATAAQKKALVLGTHFAGTSAGYVVPVGDGYRFEMA